MVYAGLESGWCIQCGRRRGRDGRCVHCDPWWTSPLVQLGGPAVALCCLALLIAVTVFGSRAPQNGSDGSFSSRPSSLLSPSMPAPAQSLAPPPLSMPATAYAYAAPAPVYPSPISLAEAPSPDAILVADFQRLRRMVWSANAAARGAFEPSTMPAESSINPRLIADNMRTAGY